MTKLKGKNNMRQNRNNTTRHMATRMTWQWNKGKGQVYVNRMRLMREVETGEKGRSSNCRADERSENR